MQLQVNLSYSRDEITSLVRSALSKRGGAALDNVTVNGNSDGTVSGYAFVRGSSTLHVNFTHDVIVGCMMEAAASAGKPIEPGSLKFTYHEGRGYGGGPSVSATAQPAKNPAAAAQFASSSGISFPGHCTVHFGIKELAELVKVAARKSNLEPTYAVVSYDEVNQVASASISVKGGNVSLDNGQLNEALTEVLADRGYTVVAGGFKYSYSHASYGSPSGTSVTVTVTGIPSRI